MRLLSDLTLLPLSISALRLVSFEYVPLFQCVQEPAPAVLRMQRRRSSLTQLPERRHQARSPLLLPLHGFKMA